MSKVPSLKNTHSILAKWHKLLLQTNLKPNSSHRTFIGVVEALIKSNKIKKESSFPTFKPITIKSFNFDKKISFWDKYDHVDVFERFLFTIKSILKNGGKLVRGLANLKTKRQASPPIEVYEMKGHNWDHNAKKMSYAYLYD